MKKIIATFVIFLVGCATQPTGPQELSIENQRGLAAVDGLNNKIYGDVLVDKRNFDEFTLQKHQELANGYKSQRVQEAREYLSDFERQEVVPNGATFIHCGFSAKHSVAFCDNAACAGIERRVATENPGNTMIWAQDLQKKPCQK